MGILIKGGTLVNELTIVPKDILIDEDKIVAIGYDIDPSPDDVVIDAAGLVVFPGLIDMHTHFDLVVGNFHSSDDFDSGTASAIAGGTTTVVDYITPDRDEDPKLAIDRWFEKAKSSRIDFSFHLCLTDASDRTLDAMEYASEMGIKGFKVFQAYPDRLMLSSVEIEKIMIKAHSLGCVVFVHSEKGELIEKLRDEEAAVGHLSPIYHSLTRPAAAEGISVREILELVYKTNCPTVIVHVSSGDVLPVLRDAESLDLPLFGETCPQYLWLNINKLSEDAPEAAGYICSPPLRNASHMNRLWGGLTDGYLHFISTDHCPFTMEEKLSGGNDFRKVPNGLPGVETRFPLMQSGSIQFKRFGLAKLSRLLSTNPAKICGLYPQKGTLRVGSDADLFLFDPETVTSLNEADLHSKCGYSPYENMMIAGGIYVVMSQGKFVYDGVDITAQMGTGRFVRRSNYKKSIMNSIRTEKNPWAFCV